MAKQLLIYDNVVALDKSKHRNLSIKAVENYTFAKAINSAPLLATEFPRAAADYAIVFTGDEAVMPSVILGINDNSFVDQGEWQGKYIPAFLRRYPFVFASDGDTFTLCLDESYDGCNEDNRGERLFDSDGEQTQYLKNVLEFLKTYQIHYQMTKSLCKKLLEYDLLEPMEASYNIKDKTSGNLKGFKAVSRNKLKQLTPEQLHGLAQTDELELLYQHLSSMSNFSRMIESIAKND